MTSSGMSRREFLTLSMAGAVGALVGLAGCATGGGASTAPAASGAATDAAHKIAMIIDGSINDGGWGASAYQAMTGAADKLGWACAYSENVSQSDWSTTIQNYLDQGYDTVFAPGNQYQDAMSQVAKDYPDAHFIILDGNAEGDNIENLMPNNAQIGQLAGSLAGLLTKTGSVGFIGGTELDPTKEKEANYAAAAKKANPGVDVKSAYAGSFNDAAKGKEIANSMIKQSNVDVIFGDASVVDTGSREALAAAPGTMDIGQPDDLGGADDELIANSVITDNESMIEQSMRNVEDGSFGGKTIDGNLSNGGIKMGTFSDKLVTQEQKDRFAEIVKQVEEGSFLDA